MNWVLRVESKYKEVCPIVYQLLASLFFSLTAFTVKRLKNIPPSQCLYTRSLIAMLFTNYFIQEKQINCYPKNKVALKRLILRGLIGGAGTVAWFQAMQLIPTSEVIVLTKISPLWTALIAAYITKTDKINANLMISIILCIIGVAFIARPPFLLHILGYTVFQEISEQHTLGVTFGLISSLTQAITYVLISQLAKQVNQIAIFQYFSFFTIILPILYQMYSPFQEMKIPDISEIIWLFLSGIFGCFAQLFMNRSFIQGNVNKMSLIGQSQVIFSYLIDIFLLHQQLDRLSVFGTILVCSCLINVTFFKMSHSTN